MKERVLERWDRVCGRECGRAWKRESMGESEGERARESGRARVWESERESVGES